MNFPQLRLITLLAWAVLALVPIFTARAQLAEGLQATIVASNAPAADKIPKLKVTPNRVDWTYALKSQPTITIRINVTPFPASGVNITYRLGLERFEGPEIPAVVTSAGYNLTVQSPVQPGFVRCIVKMAKQGQIAEETVTVTLGFEPHNIKPSTAEPADFDNFWRTQMDDLARIEPDFQTELMSTANSNPRIYQLSFNTLGVGGIPSRFYGILCIPSGTGPFPALISFPGAGVRAYRGETSRASGSKPAITLQMGINGIPVNLPDKNAGTKNELYSDLEVAALGTYVRFNLDDPENFYMRRVYLGCLRAAQYLIQHPQWDNKNLIVTGSSQGGQLALMTAALFPNEVTGLAVGVPGFCDTTGFLSSDNNNKRPGGWPSLFSPYSTGTGRNDSPFEKKIATIRYYDTVNFASRITQPGFYWHGYNDDVAAPTCFFAAYNLIKWQEKAQKQLILALEAGHTPTMWNQSSRRDAWIQNNIRRN